MAQYTGGPLMDASIPYVGADYPIKKKVRLYWNYCINRIDTGVHDFNVHPDFAHNGEKYYR